MRSLRFDVEDDLYLRLKMQSAKERKSMRALIIEALERLLQERGAGKQA